MWLRPLGVPGAVIDVAETTGGAWGRDRCDWGPGEGWGP